MSSYGRLNIDAMMKKWMIILVSSCLALGFVVFLMQLSPIYDIHGYNFQDVKSIKIYDRGLFGNDVVEITDRNKIKEIGRLINTSTHMDVLSYNPKASKGLCELDLISKNGKTTEIVVDHNMDVGGIIQSGQWEYKSDSLLSIILKELGNKKK